MKLEIVGHQGTIAVIDLGDGACGYFTGESIGGNLYLHLDGEEYGSLFINPNDDTGQPEIALGQFDGETQDWEYRARLTETVQQIIDRAEAGDES